MEVKGISQGGQTTFETNKSIEKPTQVYNAMPIERVKVDDNNSTGNKNISEKEIRDSVDKLNSFLFDNKTHAEYEYHDKLKNDLMIKIIDDRTGEVIQEVPSKKILDMVAKMLEIVGFLIDKKA